MNEYCSALEEDGVAIFLFHGVIHRQRHAIRNYTRKHLVEERFVEVLEALRRTGRPVSMSEISEALRTGHRLPPRAFAVTFDDGFENNCSIAAPVLKALEVPATFYVTTGFIGTGEASWTDRLEYAFERAGPVAVAVPPKGQRHVCATEMEKRQLLDELRRVIKSERTIDPYTLADDVWRQLGVETMEPDPELDRKMSWRQLEELEHHPLFLIGGHSHTHRILEFLDDEELEREIATSVRLIRERLGFGITFYSYPEGLPHCYSERVMAALRRHGVVCAVTAEPGVNRIGDDLFRLKRILVS